MIAYLQGKILRKGGSYLVVETGGVGYKVAVSGALALSAKLSWEVRLHIHTHVREDQLSLYGFASLPELELFEMLISVSGIGPKVGLSILSSVSPAHIRSAIISGDIAVFTKVAGVGRKTAERLMVELKEKVASAEQDQGGLGVSAELSESLSALESLGYRRHEIKEVLKQIPKDLTDSAQIVRHALKVLGGRR
ncbi:MAG: Holliday junction branch migration protein RuvA [Candidatus Doudnabacteria bacterium]|nr:Holliday junction branch migration protein RuvA [Candidatus Doudnabacteria bacterium]